MSSSSGEGPGSGTSILGRLAGWGLKLRKGPSFSVGPNVARIGGAEVADRLARLGSDGRLARELAAAAEEESGTLHSLSLLTSSLALDYLDRLARPIPALRPATGVEMVTLGYAAHLAVEADPARFGAVVIPVLGTLPQLRRGEPPRDLLTRAVKASRKDFSAIRAVSAPVWDGLVLLFSERAHRAAPGGEDLLQVEVVDGLARFGWVLRQVDLHYGQAPQRRMDAG